MEYARPHSRAGGPAQRGKCRRQHDKRTAECYVRRQRSLRSASGALNANKVAAGQRKHESSDIVIVATLATYRSRLWIWMPVLGHNCQQSGLLTRVSPCQQDLSLQNVVQIFKFKNTNCDRHKQFVRYTYVHIL